MAPPSSTALDAAGCDALRLGQLLGRAAAAGDRLLAAGAPSSPARLRVGLLELTLYGHCVRAAPAWNGRREPVFSLRRAPWWRRLLGRAPVLACTLQAEGDTVRVQFAPALGAPPLARAVRTLHLAPALQDALLRAHAQALAGA